MVSGSWKAGQAAKHRSQELCVALTLQVLLSLFGHSVMFVPPLWTGAHQAPLSMGFPRQEYWNGLPVLQGIFLTQRLNPRLLHYRQILYHWATREAPQNCIRGSYFISSSIMTIGLMMETSNKHSFCIPGPKQCSCVHFTVFNYQVL